MTEGVGVGEHTFHFGDPGDIPIAGDFDGDGKDTISIYRPSTGEVHITNTLPPNGGALEAEVSYVFGDPGDKPFAGDFDGDGKDTIGLHRESTGIVYFRNSHTTGEADNEFYFGIPGDRLVAGDWSPGGMQPPDGIDTPAVFRPSTSTWYFRFENTQGVADRATQWGLPHWIPLVGNIGLG